MLHWLLFFFCVFIQSARATELYSIDFYSDWDTPKRILLTGFGPFGSISDNPSGRIVHQLRDAVQKKCATTSSLKSLLLPVNPGIIESTFQDHSTTLSIGVDAGTSKIRVEQAARNVYQDPQTGIVETISTKYPLHHVLWGSHVPSKIETQWGEFEVIRGNEWSAGTYVCNDTYFRLTLNGEVAYFLHIPNVPKSKDQNLVDSLSSLACALFEQ